MIRFKIGISLIAVLALTATARATPVTFSLQNGTFGSGATISGTVVIDTATGSLASADLTYTFGGSSVTFNRAFYAQGVQQVLLAGNFAPVTYGGVVDGPGSPTASPVVVDEFDLLLPLSSLVGYTGGPVCTDASYYCGGGVASAYYGRTNFPGFDGMTTGSLVPPTAAPEPSELVLTLTGTAYCAFIAVGRLRRIKPKPTNAFGY